MQSLSESAWARGWSDTKKGFGAWQFWGLEVFGGGLMAIFVNPAAALIFVLGMVIALWIGATAGAPLRQRNELREIVNVESKKSLLSWFELEARFKGLENALQGGRIDWQTGSHGQHWRIAAAQDEDAKLRFRTLAAMAGARLFRDFPSEIEKNRGFDSESDPVWRWYKALVLIGERNIEGPTIEEVNKDGDITGHIYTGEIKEPATASATLCLELASWEVENVSR